ncbi:GCD1 Nucleoside-diphosphate-sugar pyrophosphorylase involved in lipopolysaccharide biosynthesis/translation initiation factor 2B, gamma/epsilon subunits (eIF-2Bgamma/eIF-2Bepsilon) [Candidatus Methylopumilus universalis]
MKAVILAGGLGSRLSEETYLKPKPMVEIGTQPIIWHIMKHLSFYGINEFVICLGYKGYIIKEYFMNYIYHLSDININLNDNSVEILNNLTEKWKVTLIETGEDTSTGGRIKKIANQLSDNENFILTYGDGLSNVNINKLTQHHIDSKKLATVTAVKPPGRFGALNIKKDTVIRFEEKPLGDGGYINGGFFVLNKKIIGYINGDDSVWEQEPLKKLSSECQLNAFVHDGFWAAMDTLRDKRYLEELWRSNKAPWKVWD